MYHILVDCGTPEVHAHLMEALGELRQQHSGPGEFRFNDLDESSLMDADNNTRRLLIHELVPGYSQQDREEFLALRARLQPKGFQFLLLCHDSFNYIKVAQDFDIGNIIMERQFDHGVLGAVIKRLLGPHFFGLNTFFPEGFPEYELRFKLSGQVDRSQIFDTHFSGFSSLLPDKARASFNIAFNELLINALAYGIAGISPEQRDNEWASAPTVIDVPTDRALEIHLVQDHEKWGLSVSDRSGSLTLRRVLEKIGRHLSFGDQLLPEGIEDLSGRGLFLLSRENRMVINVLKGIKTEIIAMQFNDPQRNRYQSLIINERETAVGS